MKTKHIKGFVLAALLCAASTTFAADLGRPEINEAALLPKNAYTLKGSVEVFGRQGVATDGNYFYVSGSKTLTKYDMNWNEIARNTDPFKGYAIPANHIGDIDVYNNELYVSSENFMDGVGKDIQIAVHDADTLALKRTFRLEPSSGQEECSGILERTLNDVTFQGEIEGLTVNPKTNEMHVLYNRGSRIVLGMVKGFYPGYDKEISEVFTYGMKPIKR